MVRKSDRAFIARPLAIGKRFCVLLRGPLFRVASAEVPEYSGRGRRPKHSPLVQLAVGAMSALHGADRRADPAIEYQWSLLATEFDKAGITLDQSACPDTAAFRYYRDHVLREADVVELLDAFRDMDPLQARAMGLLADRDQGPWWCAPALERTLVADATWHDRASKVSLTVYNKFRKRTEEHRTRSKNGNARILTDLDRSGNARGYCEGAISVRGNATDELLSSRMIVDLVHCPDGQEMEPMLPRLESLVDRFPDGIDAVIYDGAMRGTDHERLRSHGVVTVNRAAGVSCPEQWTQYLGRPIDRQDCRHKTPKKAEPREGFPEESGRILPMTLAGCTHPFTVACGTLYHAVPGSDDRWIRIRVAELQDCRRITFGHGYRFLLDFAVYCPDIGGFHTFPLDSCAKLQSLNNGIPLAAIPAVLGAVSVFVDPEVAAPAVVGGSGGSGGRGGLLGPGGFPGNGGNGGPGGSGV